jgi:hypothetical protein
VVGSGAVVSARQSAPAAAAETPLERPWREEKVEVQNTLLLTFQLALMKKPEKPKEPTKEELELKAAQDRADAAEKRAQAAESKLKTLETAQPPAEPAPEPATPEPCCRRLTETGEIRLKLDIGDAIVARVRVDDERASRSVEHGHHCLAGKPARCRGCRRVYVESTSAQTCPLSSASVIVRATNCATGDSSVSSGGRTRARSNRRPSSPTSPTSSSSAARTARWRRRERVQRWAAWSTDAAWYVVRGERMDV